MKPLPWSLRSENLCTTLAICILSTLFLISPSTAIGTELLVEGKTAEIKIDVVYVKTGAGKAFIDRGRLYKGDLVTILSKENLSNWVRIQSGRLTGYIPLKVLRFDTRTTQQNTEPNMLRRQQDYEYDPSGRRIKRSGEPVGSGEAKTEKAPQVPHNLSNEQTATILRFGIGFGQFERTFSSNAPIQSILSRAQAKPLVLTTFAELNYLMSSRYVLAVRFVDYRMGITQLQTPVLNEGLPFDIENEGQLLNLASMMHWKQINFVLSGGPSLSLQRHYFQTTEPTPVFLSSVTTSVGLKAIATARIPGAELTFGAVYARALNSSQSPQSSGALKSGDLWSIRTTITVPTETSLSWFVEGLVSSEDVERLGESTHIDAITDPNNDLSYTGSKEENRLSAVVFGLSLAL